MVLHVQSICGQSWLPLCSGKGFQGPHPFIASFFCYSHQLHWHPIIVSKRFPCYQLQKHLGSFQIYLVKANLFWHFNSIRKVEDLPDLVQITHILCLPMKCLNILINPIFQWKIQLPSWHSLNIIMDATGSELLNTP